MYKYTKLHGEIYENKPVDLILRHYFPDPEKSGIFFDVGAFEPIRISNSYHFEQNGWDCYCFEANSNLIPLLKSKRKNVYNYAIANENKDNISFNIVHTDWDNGNDWTGSYSAINISEDYNKIYPMPQNHTIEVINVPQKTLNTIIETEIPEVKSIDILSIDVEGGEMNVLYGLDLIKYTPKVIVIENLTNDSNIHNYLENNGYKLDAHISYNQFFVHISYMKLPVCVNILDAAIIKPTYIDEEIAPSSSLAQLPSSSLPPLLQALLDQQSLLLQLAQQVQKVLQVQQVQQERQVLLEKEIQALQVKLNQQEKQDQLVKMDQQEKQVQQKKQAPSLSSPIFIVVIVIIVIVLELSTRFTKEMS